MPGIIPPGINMTFRNFFFSVAVIGMTASSSTVAEPFPSTYAPHSSDPVLIVNATILTGTGERFENGSLLMSGGRIDRIAAGPGEIDAGDAQVIDAEGRWVTPGLIDVHSHLGVYASPSVKAHSDGNEATAPVTAQVWAEHSVWPQDPGFNRARAGGVTAMQILPGSANLIGGRGVTLKNMPSVSYQGMKFPGAPHGLKMACGENPKRVYGGKNRAPGTRMGNVAGYRAAWIEAADYRDKIRAADEVQGEAPTRDLRLDTLM